MDISLLLPRDHVVLGLAGSNRRAILRRLAAPLVQEGTVTDAEAFLDDLESRERQITTQIAGGAAFPHARSRVVRHLALTVGVAPAPGLAFGDAESALCRLFFLIAVPPGAPTAHLPLLRYLSGFVRCGTRVQHLLEATAAGRAVRILNPPAPRHPAPQR